MYEMIELGVNNFIEIAQSAAESEQFDIIVDMSMRGLI
jgi:hypothetical protein